MADVEPCRAGLITVEDQLFGHSYANTVTEGMIQTAQSILAESPDIGVRDLTYRIADGDIWLDTVVGGKQDRIYVWGPTGSREVQSGAVTARDRLVVTTTGLKTSRLALAVAICATRDCDFRGSCQRSE